LPGTQGETGATGATGPKGDAGTNAQNMHVVDSASRDFGVALGTYGGAASADVIYDGGIWTLSNTSDYQVTGALNMSSIYSDSSCSTPLAYNANSLSSSTSNPALRGVYRSSNGSAIGFKLTGTPFKGSTLAALYARAGTLSGGIRECVSSTNATYTSYFSEDVNLYFSPYVTVTVPTFTAPFTLVSK